MARVFSATRRAFTLPPMHVTATSSTSGEAQAYRSASASSMPVSTSRSSGIRAGIPPILSANEPDQRSLAIQASSPGRAGRLDLGAGQLGGVIDGEAVVGERSRRCRDEVLRRSRHAIEAVALEGCDEELQD